MAYPSEASVETAVVTIELVLVENPQFQGNRELVGLWRELLRERSVRVPRRWKGSLGNRPPGGGSHAGVRHRKGIRESIHPGARQLNLQ